jgi:hypothetical protein
MVIVCERGNNWAIALRFALQESRLRVFETRTWADSIAAWEQSPQSVIAVELRTNNLVEVVRNLAELRRRSSGAAAVVLAEREMAECEWIVREAGAIYVARSKRNLSPLARLLVRAVDSRMSLSLEPADAGAAEPKTE